MSPKEGQLVDQEVILVDVIVHHLREQEGLMLSTSRSNTCFASMCNRCLTVAFAEEH
jgi:hypothetical protein